MAFKRSLEQRLAQGIGNGERKQGDGVSGKGQVEDKNKYSEALPGLLEQAVLRQAQDEDAQRDVKENKSLVSSFKFLGKETSEQETRNQKLETSGSFGNAPTTKVEGILDQKVISTSKNPAEQLKAELLNNGAKVVKKGVKMFWDHFTK